MEMDINNNEVIVNQEGEPSTEQQPINTIQEATARALEYMESQDNQAPETSEEVTEPEAVEAESSKEIPEGTQTEATNNLPDFSKMFDDFKSEIANMVSQQNTQSTAEQDENTSNEEEQAEEEPQPEFNVGELENEELLEKFYENPREVVSLLAKQQAEKMVEPIIKEREMERAQQAQEKQIKAMQDKIISFAMENEGFNDHIDKVTEIINNNPDLANKPNALKIAYSMAQSGIDDNNSEQFIEMAVDNFVKSKDINNLLKDEKIKNQIMDNESIKKEIISNYLKKVGQGEKPISIGSTPKGKPPVREPNEKPKTFQDAVKATLASWQ